MNVKKRIHSLLLFTVAAISCAAISAGYADQPARALLPKELAGSWVGYDEGCLHFFRLVLTERGTGSCIKLFREKVSGKYSVKWHLEDGKVRLAFSAADPDSEPILITAEYVDLIRMEVVVKGVAGDWERKACFYNEREFMRRLQESSRHAMKSEGKGSAELDKIVPRAQNALRSAARSRVQSGGCQKIL